MAGFAFLEGGGGMGARMRAHDWSTSPLGDPDGWPQSLRSVVALMINSRYPMFVAWGPELAFLYNDGYAPIFGAKHPNMLGLPFRQAWSEIWDDIAPLVDRALAGESTYDEDLHLVMERNGYPEDTWYDFSYSPVRDESGAVAGMFCACMEKTETVLAKRAAQEREDYLRAVFEQVSEGVITADTDGRITFVNRCAEELHGVSDLTAKPTDYSQRYHLFTEDGAPYPSEQLPLARAVLNGETVDDARWRIRRPDGSEILAIGSARPINGPTDQQIGSVLTMRDDTQRFASEVALRESEMRFRNLADSSPMMVWVTDADARCAFLSKSWYDFTGQTAETALGFGWLDAVHPDDREWSGEIFLKANEKRESFRLEYRLRRHNGEYRWAIDAASPRFGADGAFLGYVGSVIDIEDRREVEVALRASEERYRGLVTAIGRVVWRTMPDGSVVDMPDWRAITGQSQEEVRGHGWLDALHPDDRERTARLWNEALEAGAPVEVDYRMRLSDGSYRWVNSRGVPVLGDDGAIREWVGVCIDINEQKLAEEDLRASEERYRTLFNSIDEGFCVIEFVDGPHGPLSDYVHVEANPAYTKEAGIPDVVGQYVRQMVPDEAEGWVDLYRNVLVSGEPIRFQRELEATGRVLELFAARLEPESRRQVMVLFRDVSASIEAERALLKLNETLEHRVAEEVERRSTAEEALRQAQKMEAIGQLTGGIAHDFNNLLQIISGNLDILKRGLTEDAPRLHRSIDNALKGADRAAVLTQRLLAFSRRQPLAPKVIDPNKLVSGMSEMLHRTLGETYGIETVTGSGLWRVEADPNQLEGALLNLAINARDAMPDGGKLTIETANAHIDRDYAERHGGVTPGQYVVICLSDTGGGMDPATVERAIEPFFTTKDVGKGTGLGLSMVYGFVKQSGGHLKIYSEPGEGTTVKIYLPRHQGPETELSVGAGDEVPEGMEGETILVCEDDEDVRVYSAEVLRELGYRVIEAADGEAALRLLEAEGGRVDLLFTDIVLPGGMTGAVVAERAREAQPGIKVLFTTGYARNAIVHQGRLDPGVELLSKPFAYAELAARIRDLLDAD